MTFSPRTSSLAACLEQFRDMAEPRPAKSRDTGVTGDIARGSLENGLPRS
jgi:hypothetical protein